MPILEVEIVLQPGERLAEDLAQALADQLGRILKSAAGNTWVKLRPLPPRQYAENETAQTMFPVFVSVLAARRPSAAEMEQIVPQMTTAVAAVCQRSPENVHILFLADAAGRIAFGGQIVPEKAREQPDSS